MEEGSRRNGLVGWFAWKARRVRTMPLRDDGVDRQTDFWKQSPENNRDRIDLELKLVIQENEGASRLHMTTQSNNKADVH